MKLALNRKSLLSFLVVLKGLFLGYALLDVLGYRINLSHSMAMGIYKRAKRSQIHRGDIVAVCLPDALAKAGLRQGYLHAGRCLSGASPVLKKVIALPSDTVALNTKGFTVNVDGHRYFFRAPHKNCDHRGQPIQQWVALGVPATNRGYWLYGDYDVIHSWDSRYYGPIQHAHIQGIYRPVWVF